MTSSRFSGPLNTQTKPRVCRAPPQPPSTMPDVWFQWVLQARAVWNEPGTPGEIIITGRTDLLPDPATTSWNGQIEGENHTVDVDLTYEPATDDYSVVLTLLSNGSVIGQRELTSIKANRFHQFDTHLLTFPNPPAGGIIEARLLA